MTAEKRSMTIGFGASAWRATIGCLLALAEADSEVIGLRVSAERATRAASGRADCGVHSLRTSEHAHVRTGLRPLCVRIVT